MSDTPDLGEPQGPSQKVIVPEGANEEITPPEIDSLEGNNCKDSGETERVTDPEAEHRRGLEKTRLNYAIVILAVSAFMVVILILIDIVVWESADKREINLANIADFFKLTGTTALGFILGKQLSADK
ncbi:hypothetical protein FRC0507_00122 [Corynebacterium diphtheriae]|nr:hypothetical protein FRC0507_00122 [Corynebacterium diphtheriae]